MPDEIQVKPTSRYTAESDPIVLRTDERNTRRLVFRPVFVANDKSPEACINGDFVYERKNADEQWEKFDAMHLGRLQEGEGVRISLRSSELLKFYTELENLYSLRREQGIPKRKQTYVALKGDRLLRIVNWLASSPERQDAVQRLMSIAPERVTEMRSLLGVAALKDALAFFNANQSREQNEEFWQQELAVRSFVFSQVFAYPVVIIKQKAYVGGKLYDNSSGYIVDYMAKAESTNAIVLIEIKKPQTKLLGREYRNEVFGLSEELSASVSQVLKYRQSLTREFLSVTRKLDVTDAEPSCLLVAGSTSELDTPAKRDCFHLQRHRVQGLTIITYDELFSRVQKLVTLLETGR